MQTKEITLLGVGIEIRYSTLRGKEFILLCKKCGHQWPPTPKEDNGIKSISGKESCPSCSCEMVMVCEVVNV